MKNSPLKIEIVDGVLSITLGVDTLCHAISVGRYGSGEIKINDNKVFANEILVALNEEEEDGTNSVHTMLDKAADAAIENGAFGADHVG